MTQSPAIVHQNTQQTQQLISRLQGHMALYGYHTLETPIIENADLFLTKAGDKVSERLFTFERHGKQLALRPEFTAAALHHYIHHHAGATVRWQFSGAVFDDDPTKTERLFQQYSIGAELIGLAGAMAEAEIISMVVQGVVSAGIDDWRLVIGHVGLTRYLLAGFGLESRTQDFILRNRHLLHDGGDGRAKMDTLLTRYLPKVDPATAVTDGMNQADTQELLDILLNTSRANATMGGRTRHDIARRLLKKRQQAVQRDRIEPALDFLREWGLICAHPIEALQTIADYVSDDAAHAIYDRWKETLTLLDAAGVDAERIIIQPDLARTWDYYTGIVFDLRTVDGLRLAGGGRYDELSRLIGGGDDVPAVGFAYYADHLLDLTASTGGLMARAHHLTYEDAAQTDALRWAAALRERGLTILMGVSEQVAGDLHVDTAGMLHANDKSYSLSAIDALLAEIDG